MKTYEVTTAQGVPYTIQLDDEAAKALGLMKATKRGGEDDKRAPRAGADEPTVSTGGENVVETKTTGRPGAAARRGR